MNYLKGLIGTITRWKKTRTLLWNSKNYALNPIKAPENKSKYFSCNYIYTMFSELSAIFEIQSVYYRTLTCRRPPTKLSGVYDPRSVSHRRRGDWSLTLIFICGQIDNLTGSIPDYRESVKCIPLRRCFRQQMNLVLDRELFIPAASVYFRCGPEGLHGRKKLCRNVPWTVSKRLNWRVTDLHLFSGKWLVLKYVFPVKRLNH